MVSGCVANKQWALLKVLGCYFGDADRLSPAVHAEELLAAIAAATGERVCVPAERWPLLEMLSLPTDRLFTTDTRATRIHAVLRHSVCSSAAFSDIFWEPVMSCCTGALTRCAGAKLQWPCSCDDG